MIKKSSFFPFPPKLFTLMVDIIILNPIGSFKVDFDSTFFCFEAHFLPQNSSWIIYVQKQHQCGKEYGLLPSYISFF
jgi:hypothetical protein